MDKHQHFLGRLKACGDETLQPGDPVRPRSTTRSESTASSQRFANYYEVLGLDADYFDEGEVDDNEANDGFEGAGKEKYARAKVSENDSKKRARVARNADRAALFNEAFSQDLFLEVVSYFLELEELMEGVFGVYHQVKTHCKTLFEATAVVKDAIECAKSLTTKLQAWYPSIKLAQDVLVVLSDNLPSGFLRKKMTLRSWHADDQVPLVLNILASFTSAIPANHSSSLFLREGFFSETYSEENTPHYLLPDANGHSALLLQQLPLLFNAVHGVEGNNKNDKLLGHGLTGEFLVLMDEYFTAKRVTLPLVFTTICWLKSIACLQGNGGLRRSISLAIKHSWDMFNKLDATLKKGTMEKADQSFIKRSCRYDYELMNPLVPGS
uniref:DUF6604 domain-containing protein n=1 Tax=Globisporangium ultimum (strain ATCC 200006 / CBS 805.95 / DAOM BR144) TaxID=431595 RepID=K3WJG5_GLOUD